VRLIAGIVDNLRDLLHYRRLLPSERTDLIAWLASTHHTIDQIRDAAYTVLAMDKAHNRPMAPEYWIKAFAEPIYPSHVVIGLEQKAYQSGYSKGVEEGRKVAERLQPPQAPQGSLDAGGMFRATKELQSIREERDQFKTELAEITVRLTRANERIELIAEEHKLKEATIAAERAKVEELRRILSENGIPIDKIQAAELRGIERAAKVANG
jgi:hypothetical protein